MSPKTVRWLPIVLVALAVLLVAVEAAARVGGGEGFSGGGRGSGGGGGSSGGGSSGGGGGEGAFELVYLLLWLCIEFPAIGIPLVCILVTLGLLYFAFGGAKKALRTLNSGSARNNAPVKQLQTRKKPKGPDFGKLAKVDPAFSMPVLLDFVQLVHRRAADAAVRKDWGALLPFVNEAAQKQLEEQYSGIRLVNDVILGALTPTEVSTKGERHRVVFSLENARRETRTDGTEQRVLVTERWTFERAATARSLPPEQVRRMGCPSCGAASETDAQGRCTSCGTPITDGRMQWQCVQVQVTSPRIPLPAPSYAPAPGGVEPGYHEPTVLAPDLPVQLRSLVGRHPDFEPQTFVTTATEIFLELQAAWSEGRWEKARPHTTDPMFDTLRFWMDRYEAAGLHNRLDQVEVERVEIVDASQDAWYEAVTVRIWANACDYVVDRQGKVVGGNAKKPRSFSEYWTFLRSSGGSGSSKDSKHCPSCGAPLDRVNQAGVCGYCDTRITSGEFNWVLSRIAQPEAMLA